MLKFACKTKSNMEINNECDTNHLDSEVLLPPRKRLLAGLKRQTSESTSQGSGSPQSSTSDPLTEFNLRLQNLLKSYKNGIHMSPQEIAKAAKSEADAAAKAAEAARAEAEEKTAIALKAVAAAKDALSIVASFSKTTRKNKLKKRVPVQHLYMNRGTDEELARIHKLHRMINVSPSHSPGSEFNNKLKRMKISVLDENNGFSDTMEVRNGKSPCGLGNQVKESCDESESRQLMEKVLESLDDMNVNGGKKGRRIKPKKLSFCSLKDNTNPKAETKESISSDITQTWKCQDFNVSHCSKPKNVVQS